MRPPEERTYIAVPTYDGLVAPLGHGLTTQTRKEIEERLSIAASLACLANPRVLCCVDWQSTSTHAFVIAAEGVSVTLYRPPYEYGLSVDVPVHGLNRLYLGASPLTDAGFAQANRVEDAELSNDYLWHVKLTEHTHRLRTNPNETGSFYAENNRNIYGWFAFENHGHPQTEPQFFADPRLYLGARDKVIRELRRFDFSRSALFDSIITGTIFARNNQPVPPLAASHPV
jgi:hypothetical protein